MLPRYTRRGAVTRGVALAGGAGGGLLLLPARALADDDEERDRAVLRELIGLERSAVRAYEAALRAPGLDADTRRRLELFRAHERRHEGALTAALEERGGEAPAAGPTPQAIPPLSRPGSERFAIRSLIGIEETTLAAYHAAHTKLGSPSLLELAPTIMASEGQHLALLRDSIGLEPVGRALESGRRR